jgi:NAD(P)-dependent dehydrogenase (short-subunit alcohol dehydrogenase family)
MLAQCSRPGYTLYCNELMPLQQFVATIDRTWGGYTIKTPTLHLLEEFLMSTFSVAGIPDMTGKTVIVTGANSGIGLAIARTLAAVGARIVFAVRSTEKGRAVATATVGVTEVRELDLASLDSVRAFAAGWDGEIDLLINNAGIGGTSLARTADGFEIQFGTNHLGHFALTNLLLAHVTGRVVTVSSQAERFAHIDFDDLNWEHKPYQSSRAYAQSKLANLLFTAELQRRLNAAGSGVLATAAHPGFVATNIYNHSGRRPSNLSTIAIRLLAQNADSGALPVLYAAVGNIPGNSFTGPRYFAHMRGGSPVLIGRSATAQNADLARRLWAVSEQLTGICCPLQPVP